MSRRYLGFKKPKVQLDRTKITNAFKEMRKAGLLAFQNYSCCSTCGGYEIATRYQELITKTPQKAAEVQGCCFYHQQDAAGMRSGSYLCLRYGKIEAHSEEGIKETPKSNKEVGDIICKILELVGLRYEWNGSEDRCIMVTGTQG